MFLGNSTDKGTSLSLCFMFAIVKKEGSISQDIQLIYQELLIIILINPLCYKIYNAVVKIFIMIFFQFQLFISSNFSTFSLFLICFV